LQAASHITRTAPAAAHYGAAGVAASNPTREPEDMARPEPPQHRKPGKGERD